MNREELIQKSLKTDSSIPRNPILASAFRAVRLAENAGFGFDKMIDGWKAYNKSKPIIYSDLTSTIMTFSFSDADVTENVTENRELQILKILQTNQTITTSELAEKFNVSRRTIARDMENLKRKNKIKRIGSDKSGYWEVTK